MDNKKSRPLRKEEKVVLFIAAVITLCVFAYRYYEYQQEKQRFDNLWGDVVERENWNCTYDCSGHEAGYEWGKTYGIGHPDDCDGKSDSFIEGCKTYTYEKMIEDAEKEAKYNDSLERW